MKTKQVEVFSMLQVSQDTHTLIKESAKKANMTIREYVRVIAEASRSDAGRSRR